MRKLLLALALLVSSISYAQDSTSTKVTPYIAAGISVSNGSDFELNSYPSFEAGIMIDNVSIAGVFGRNNLAKADNKSFDNYWYELKTAFSFPLGSMSGYGIVGAGSYIGSPGSLFIEYGIGVSKEFNNNLGVFLQVSSWDGVNYVTPGLSYSF